MVFDRCHGAEFSLSRNLQCLTGDYICKLVNTVKVVIFANLMTANLKMQYKFGLPVDNSINTDPPRASIGHKLNHICSEKA